MTTEWVETMISATSPLPKVKKLFYDFRGSLLLQPLCQRDTEGHGQQLAAADAAYNSSGVSFHSKASDGKNYFLSYIKNALRFRRKAFNKYVNLV